MDKRSIKTRSDKHSHPGLLGTAACLLLLACTPASQVRSEALDYIVSPDGAVAPPGVSQLKRGMSQEAVLSILTPLYSVTHAADAEPGSPIADFFAYSEDGETKYIEVSYDDGGNLDWLRFGYSKTYVLE